MPHPMPRLVLAILLQGLTAASISAQDALPDLNGIWRLGDSDKSQARFQQVDNVVTARFLGEATISILTGDPAEKGAPDTSSTFDSMKGEFVGDELTGQFNLYYFNPTPIPGGVMRGWQLQDATFEVSEDQQTIDVETEDRRPGRTGTVDVQYTRVSYLPPIQPLTEDEVDDRIIDLRIDIDVLIHNKYPHMEGRLTLEEFRDFGGREYFQRVYEYSKTVVINGVPYVLVTRLICGYDDLDNLYVILIPQIDPEQPEEEEDPPPRPPLDLPRLELPQNCMVVTNLTRLQEVHGGDYPEVREFLESFGPVIDLGAHLVDHTDWEAADAVIEDHFDREAYGCLFIFGDGQIVPFGEYENPLYGVRVEDRDEIILSDDHYGDFDHDPHDSWDVMVARLPNDPAVLEAAARRLAVPHGERPVERRDFVAYGNANWPLSEILASIGNPDDPTLLLSEPSNADGFSDNFFRDQHIIINLHGSAVNGREYWGEVKQIDGASNEVVPVTAMNISQAHAPGSIILAGCCYGALIDGKHAGNCIALQFLASGAEAFVGSTMTSYIAATDERTYGLWGRLFVTDVRDGTLPQEAFLQAKREYARSLDQNPLYQFKMYHQMVYLGLPPVDR